MKRISSDSIWRFSAAAVLAMTIPMIVVAGPRMWRGGECAAPERHAMPGSEILLPWHDLELDGAQDDQVFAIMHRQAPALHERLGILHRSEAELRRLTASADYDETKVRALARAIADATLDLVILRAQIEHQIIGVLTPEQRKQLADMPPRRAPGLPPPR